MHVDGGRPLQVAPLPVQRVGAQPLVRGDGTDVLHARMHGRRYLMRVRGAPTQFSFCGCLHFSFAHVVLPAKDSCCKNVD